MPIAALALVALAVGVLIGADRTDERLRVAERFASAWERNDPAAMHALLSPTAQRRASRRRLERTYRQAAETATVRSVQAGRPRPAGKGVYRVPVVTRTAAFGDLRGEIRLPIEGEGDEAGVDWSARLAFPGLRRGEKLRRETAVAARAGLLARDGTVLAEGPERSSEAGELAAEIVGDVGSIPPERAGDYARRGIPPDTSVGLTGLERQFDARLLGRPGGTLKAGDRTLAAVPARQGGDVRTSIDPAIQRAAIDALAGRFGGIAVLKPATGEILALAGSAYSAPQPPGSTFKIITLAGALEAGAVKRSDTFPKTTAATIEGVELQNANGEVCGGTLANSFAESCNSVFGPLGAKLGAEKLVRAAERFGFNGAPSLAGQARSTIPPAGEIGDDLAVASTAIGQGKVLATPVLMASVAAAIGEGGRRRAPNLVRGGIDAKPLQVTSPGVARTVDRYMRRVVRAGTGVAAAIPGTTVAGKTGTAELRTTQGPATGQDAAPVPADTTDTTAWFAAYAPASQPRVAVAVMLVGQGAGGETAAPAAKQVLSAALKRR